MINRSSWLRLFLMAALLAAFAFSARGGVRGSEAGSPLAASCELDPPKDEAGLERCLTLFPRDIELMLDLGSTYEAGGRSSRAEALYRRALSIDAGDADIHVRLGRTLLARGDHVGAAAEARIAMGLQPGSSRALDLAARAGSGAAR